MIPSENDFGSDSRERTDSNTENRETSQKREIQHYNAEIQINAHPA